MSHSGEPVYHDYDVLELLLSLHPYR
jgi:hypothetical protein